MALNEILWDIEDRIRGKEGAGAFDAEFVALARSVYQRNGERAAQKKQLNLQLASGMAEEKFHKPGWAWRGPLKFHARELSLLWRIFLPPPAD